MNMPHLPVKSLRLKKVQTENLILGIHFLLLKKCKIFDEKTIVTCYTGRSMRIKVRKHERRGYQSIKMSNILEKQFLKQRNDFEKSCVERDKKYHFPQGVIFETDIAYAKDKNKAHRLDRYRPKGKEAQILPVIINVHGGGLLLGNKEFNKYFCALLSKKGFLVYSMEYRLIPDCTFFDQLRDIFLAMDFVKEHAAADGGDLSHVYLVGDSGGACLATYANAIQNSKKIAKAAGVKPSELKVHALGLISGMFYTAKFDKIGLFLPKYLYGKQYKKAPFAAYVNPENLELLYALAPAWLVTSHNDHLRNYTIRFEKALTVAKKEHEIVDFPKNKKLTHAFSVFEPFLPESHAVIDMLTEYLRKF